MKEGMRPRADKGSRLRQRKTELVRTLPPFPDILRGSFFQRAVRCGKPTCHCASGTGHRVTCVGVTYSDGHTEQITIPSSLVPIARRWVANYQRWRRAIEQVSAINRTLLRERLLPTSRNPRRPPR